MKRLCASPVLTAALAVIVTTSGCGLFIETVARQDPRIAIGIGAGKMIAAQAELSPQAEQRAGDRVHPVIVDIYGGIARPANVTAYIAQLGERLAAHSRRASLPWRFFVLNSWERNALCAPGGRVYVTLGLLRAVRTEAELAGAIAHEIGHVVARHPGERIRRIRTRDAAIEAANRVVNSDVYGWLPGVIGTFADDYLLKGLPVEHQIEADALAVKLLARSKHGACGLRDLVVRLPSTGRAIATLHRTHATAKRRIKALQGTVAGTCSTAAVSESFHAMQKALPAPLQGLGPG